VKPHHLALLTRRGLLGASLVPPLVILLAACGRQSSAATSGPGVAGSPQATAEAPASPPAATQVAVAATPVARPAAASTPIVRDTPTPLAPSPAVAIALSPTPACDDGDDVTPAQTEGPFFTPNSPERASLLEPGIAGTKIVLSGRVLSTSCQPVAGALVDFWQTDDRGVYDNTGFKLRGHQFTDQAGHYSLETIVPGLYPGRTRHFHVKVQAPNRRVLTTQLYFPGEASNRTDRIFHDDLVISVQDTADGKVAAFDFVLAV
jgi:protocatechuate 3,4-dioxygenase beta subunit